MLDVEIDPSKAMIKLSVADSTWQQAGREYDSIIWVSEPKVTKAEWDGAVSELQTELDAQEYARNRKADYPDWGTQLEKIADDGIDKWKSEMLAPVKAKFPKP
jgi:hypothetical protein